MAAAAPTAIIAPTIAVAPQAGRTGGDTATGGAGFGLALAHLLPTATLVGAHGIVAAATSKGGRAPAGLPAGAVLPGGQSQNANAANSNSAATAFTIGRNGQSGADANVDTGTTTDVGVADLVLPAALATEPAPPLPGAILARAFPGAAVASGVPCHPAGVAGGKTGKTVHGAAPQAQTAAAVAGASAPVPTAPPPLVAAVTPVPTQNAAPGAVPGEAASGTAPIIAPAAAPTPQISLPPSGAEASGAGPAHALGDPVPAAPAPPALVSAQATQAAAAIAAPSLGVHAVLAPGLDAAATQPAAAPHADTSKGPAAPPPAARTHATQPAAAPSLAPAAASIVTAPAAPVPGLPATRAAAPADQARRTVPPPQNAVAAPQPTTRHPSVAPTSTDAAAAPTPPAHNAIAPTPSSVAASAPAAAQDQPLAPAQPAAPDPIAGLAAPAATSTAGQTATQPATTQPASPPDQVAQAVAQVHVAPGATGKITINLHPADLGGVHIQIARASTGGGASITIQVEKPETLQALQLDTAHLHQALDRAGLATDGRSLTLHLAPQAAENAGAGGSGANPAATANTGSGAGANSGNGFNQSDGNNPGQERAPLHRTASQTLAPAKDAEPEPTSPRWQPAGVNITA